MAVENFLHDEAGISAIITDVRNSISVYNEQITALENLINSMNASKDWIDEAVKTSFINTAQSYITSYKSFSTGLSGYINCLEKKSKNVVSHESNFS